MVVHSLCPWQQVRYSELRRLDPRIEALRQKLLAARGRNRRAFSRVHRQVRSELMKLVGWSCQSRNPILRSADAWHTALAAIARIRRQRPAAATQLPAGRKVA